MRCPGFTSLFILLTLAGAGGVVNAQQPEPTRQGVIEQGQAEKSKDLRPYNPTRGERVAERIDNILTGQRRHLHNALSS